jgi:hypothetical protein
MALLQTVQLQMQSLLLLPNPLLQVLLLLQETKEVAMHVTTMGVDMEVCKGVTDMEVDQGDPIKGNAVSS